MHIVTRGLVLREVAYKEADKILTVLTEEGGKRTVKARGCRRKGSRLAAAAQLLVWSEMTLFAYRDHFNMNEATPLEQFWGVRSDMDKLALASYFAETMEAVALEGRPDPGLLSLILNSLYALDKLQKPLPLVKAAYELRLLCLAGSEPRLAACAGCGAAQPEEPRLTGQVTPEDSLEDVMEKLCTAHADALGQTMRLLEPGSVRAAVDLFQTARSVRCMGQGGSMIMASEAAHLFSTVSDKFVSVQDSHLQAITAALLGPEDVIWFFSYSGSTRDILDLMELARARKCRLVLVTHYPKSPGAALADVVIQCGASEGPLQLGSVPARMAQLYLIDVLFHEYCRRDMAATERNRAQVAQALARKHI